MQVINRTTIMKSGSDWQQCVNYKVPNI